MAECDAQFLQIGLGQIGQDIKIDGVLGKERRVLREPDPIKPSCHMVISAHCRTLFPLTGNRRQTVRSVCRTLSLP